MTTNLPKALESLSFDPVKCHLGKHPLEFKRIRIDREPQCTSVGSYNNLAIVALFEWDADCEIFLRFKGASLGIEGLRLKGRLVLDLVGLVDKPPFFEGVRAYLNRTPEVEINFGGSGEGLLNMSWVKDRIAKLVTDAISGLLVLPNRFGYAISEKADIFLITAPLSDGILEITAWGASGIAAKETTWLGLGANSSDPYVVLKCGTDTFKSPVVYKNLAPSWDWTASMVIQDSIHQSVVLEVLNDRALGEDDFLGTMRLNVHELMEWGPDQKKTLELLDHSGKATRGTVTLSAAWRPLELDAHGANLRSEGVFFAGVHSASRLPTKPEGTLYWVAVHCSRLIKTFHHHEAKATPHSPTEPKDTAGQGAEQEDSADLEERLAILKKYKMTEADMAAVLQVEPASLHEAMKASDRASKVSKDIEAAKGCVVSWETAFEFLVDSVADAAITFEVMCKEPGKSAKKLGTYQTSGASLRGCENCTEWRTVRVPGTEAMLKVKLGTRVLGQVAAAAPPSGPSSSKNLAD
uniref:C2 domain-containing protein n=1 Tax=Zooxanthella nutricula TaxID=1333877 RepID=A0A7S2Q861_9DINO